MSSALLRPQALVGACSQRFAAFKPSAKPMLAPIRRANVVERGVLQVVAAEGDKKAPKKMPSPVKRVLVSEDRRQYNRAHKSACSTRIKKVIKLAEQLLSSPIQAESDVKPLEQLISEAYKEIDKAVVKGILHQNTGARKKARCARWKRQVLIAAGFFKPEASHPDFSRYQKLNAKLAAVADSVSA